MNSVPTTSKKPDINEQITKAQRHVCTAMAACLAFWFAPVVSGIACSTAEAFLVDRVLKIMDCYSPKSSEKILWFFRKKTFFLFGATYFPVAGVPLQLFETYGLGQFAIHCALQPQLLTNNAWLEESWQAIAPEVFSGNHAVAFFEQFSGKEFPSNIRGTFVRSVNLINSGYLLSQRVPGAEMAQEFLGEGMLRLTRLGKQARERLLKRSKKTGESEVTALRDFSSGLRTGRQ